MDEQERGRIRDDLRGFFRGALYFDDLSRALYSSDASIFEVQPLGVTAPLDEEDVQALVRYAAEKNFSLVPRGAGSGSAGESLGSGLVVDLSTHFRGILNLSGDTVRAQAGVTLAALNARLHEVGQRLAVDPVNRQVGTLGGMIGRNSSGPNVHRHGYARDHIVSARMVLDDGDVADIRPLALPITNDPAPGHFHDIAAALGLLLEQNRAILRQHRPQIDFNRCGYFLDGVHDGKLLHLPRLVAGSEGTLGILTEATLRAVPLPGGVAAVLAVFAGLDQALRAAEIARSTGPIACTLMDRRLLGLARLCEAAHIASIVTPEAEAVLLVEFEEDTPSRARMAAQSLMDQFAAHSGLAIHSVAAFESDEVRSLVHLRELGLPSLYGVKGGAQPVPFIEDVAVPLESLPEFLHGVQQILQQYDATASYLIQAMTGQVHTRPFLNLQASDRVSRISALSEMVHALALDFGGTVSSQFGTGLARASWVARQVGPLYPIMRQVKAIFDPARRFNPGKIVDPDPNHPWPLRKIPNANGEARSWSLHWQPGEANLEASHCNGCGACRTEAPAERMCPIFRATRVEAATPRAKANLMRHLLAESANGSIAADEVRTVADLCVNCKMCAHECPAHVNIPRLMLEAKAANVAEHGLDRGEWFLARMDRFARWGSALPLFTNLVLGSRPTRWLLERLFGLSARRRLPRFSRRSFLRRAKKRGWTTRPKGDRPWVVYFPDLYATYVDPQIGEAVALVLMHNGHDLYVPTKQCGSGIEALANGDVDTAREIARYNLHTLAELARDGVPILCSEPSAAVMLGHDYLDLVNDNDARLVAQQTVEFTSFLGQLMRAGKLRTDFQALDLAVGHHVPCHLKALRGTIDGPDLLALVPGIRVQTIDVSCSGMAGTFGLARTNFQTSLEAGRPMLEVLAGSSIQYGASECSSCRMQMEEGCRKRALHPAEYLALAYGLMPEVNRRLAEPIRELTLR